MDEKFFLQSKTYIGLIVTLLAGVFKLGPEDIAFLNDVGFAAAQLAGLILAAWGRKDANRPVYFIPKFMRKQ